MAQPLESTIRRSPLQQPVMQFSCSIDLFLHHGNGLRSPTRSFLQENLLAFEPLFRIDQFPLVATDGKRIILVFFDAPMPVFLRTVPLNLSATQGK